MTDNIKLGSVILIGIDPADGKPTPEPEIFGSVLTAAKAIHNDAVSYDTFEAIKLVQDGKWSSCWRMLVDLVRYLGIEDE